jgi:hypothetical protein
LPFSTLSGCVCTILSESRHAALLPCDRSVKKHIIRSVVIASKQRGRPTLAEVARLFAPEAIESAWRGHYLYRPVNLIAGATVFCVSRVAWIRQLIVVDLFITRQPPT